MRKRINKKLKKKAIKWKDIPHRFHDTNKENLEKTKKEIASYWCVKCGKVCNSGEIKGSIKHPYCKRCFKEEWDDDYDKYFQFLRTGHNRPF